MDVLGAILTVEGSLFKVLGLGFSVVGSGMRLKGWVLPLYANAIFEMTFQICASCCGLCLGKPLENFVCQENDGWQCSRSQTFDRCYDDSSSKYSPQLNHATANNCTDMTSQITTF